MATVKVRANHRQLVTGREAVKLKKQHVVPCADCPWSPKALPGWLGVHTAEEWLALVHGESLIECHTTNQQCAGAAVFRANVYKSCRTEEQLRLPRNEELAFPSSQAFLAHHQQEEP